MRKVIIYVTKKNYDHFIELAESLTYIKKIETDEESKETILKHIKSGIKEVKLYKKGKLKTQNPKNFLKE